MKDDPSTIVDKLAERSVVARLVSADKSYGPRGRDFPHLWTFQDRGRDFRAVQGFGLSRRDLYRAIFSLMFSVRQPEDCLPERRFLQLKRGNFRTYGDKAVYLCARLIGLKPCHGLRNDANV